MFDQVPPASEDDPIVLRPSAGAAWVWMVLAVFFAFALIRGYLGAATTGGRIGVVIFMGACSALALWAAVYMVTHRPTMSISASEITWTKATTAKTRAVAPQILVLERSSGKDLKLLTSSRGNRKYANGLTIQGTGTTLPIRTFDPNQVKRACLTKGWQFPA
jgi:hypothetical protein